MDHHQAAAAGVGSSEASAYPDTEQLLAALEAGEITATVMSVMPGTGHSTAATRPVQRTSELSRHEWPWAL